MRIAVIAAAVWLAWCCSAAAADAELKARIAEALVEYQQYRTTLPAGDERDRIDGKVSEILTLAAERFGNQAPVDLLVDPMPVGLPVEPESEPAAIPPAVPRFLAIAGGAKLGELLRLPPLASGIEPDDRIRGDGMTLIDYTKQPQLYQFESRFVSRREAFGRNGHRSNPNAVRPWHRPAGTDDLPQVWVTRAIAIPDGQRIAVRRERIGTIPIAGATGATYQVNNTVWRWTYPIGTEVSEWLHDATGRAYVRRTRRKVRADHWEPHEAILAEPPAGYVATSRDCMDCHGKAGEHVSQLPEHLTRGEDWYGFLRGSDTVFSFRPIEADGRPVNGLEGLVSLPAVQQVATVTSGGSRPVQRTVSAAACFGGT